MSASPALSHRGRLNALKRYRDADDPDVLAAQRDLRAARCEDYIRQIVDSAPPLTDEQRTKLSGLLRGDTP